MRVSNLKDVKIGIWYLYCNIQTQSFIKVGDAAISKLDVGTLVSARSPTRNTGPVCPLKI